MKKEVKIIILLFIAGILIGSLINNKESETLLYTSGVFLLFIIVIIAFAFILGIAYNKKSHPN